MTEQADIRNLSVDDDPPIPKRIAPIIINNSEVVR